MIDTTLNLFRDPLRSLAIACWGLAVVLTVLLGWMRRLRTRTQPKAHRG